MPLLIDAYNLLHAALGSAGAGRDLGLSGLTRLLGRSRYAGQPATLVCDGHRRGLDGDRVAHVRVIFAGSGQDADGIIEHMVARDSAPGRLVVVSSDRRVQAAGRRRRCAVFSSEAFLAQLFSDAANAPAPEPPSPRERVPLGSSEVAYWLGTFGERAAWAAHIAPAAETRAGVDEPGSRSRERGKKGAAAAKAAGPRRVEPRIVQTPVVEPPVVQPRKVEHTVAERPVVEPAEVEVDSVLGELLERFPGISRDDLDMARWLGERGSMGRG